MPPPLPPPPPQSSCALPQPCALREEDQPAPPALCFVMEPPRVGLRGSQTGILGSEERGPEDHAVHRHPEAPGLG